MGGINSFAPLSCLVEAGEDESLALRLAPSVEDCMVESEERFE
jgi:hypothetical protein